MLATPHRFNLCLLIMAKNEAHVIEQALCSLTRFRLFDCWCLVDTGSTDHTVTVVEAYFRSRKGGGLPGVVIYDRSPIDSAPFHFGQARTRALRHCEKMAWFTWFMDADDVFLGDIELPASFRAVWEEQHISHFLLKFGSAEYTYWRPAIFRSDGQWEYRSVVHEYAVRIGDDDNQNAGGALLEGDYRIESRRLGDRSKNPLKYRDDAQKLIRQHETQPSDTRDMFYIGQSWFDAGEWAEALKWYTQRTRCLDSFLEEKHHSWFQLGMVHAQLGDADRAVDAWHRASQTLPHRLESKRMLLNYYTTRGLHHKAWPIYTALVRLVPFSVPPDMLYVNAAVYEYWLYDEMAQCAYWQGKVKEAAALGLKAVKGGAKAACCDIERLRFNSAFYLCAIKPTVSSQSS